MTGVLSSTLITTILAYIPDYASGYNYAASSYDQGGTSPLGSNSLYWIILIVTALLSWGVSAMMKKRVTEFSQIAIPMTGAQVAEQMLRDHGITDVKVLSTSGMLTDHYNPANKTVNLSEAVYACNNVAAAAVAAHEVGHAVQHATAYHWLALRSALVPIVTISSKLSQYVIIAGVLLLAASQGSNPWILGVGVILFAMSTLFAFVTLPVEFNASSRALAWLQREGVLSYIEHGKARSALFWAAMTYVVGALSSLATLLYYLMIFLNATSRRER
jgi:Zn-dependent membrane protease YugP